MLWAKKNPKKLKKTSSPRFLLTIVQGHPQGHPCRAYCRTWNTIGAISSQSRENPQRVHTQAVQLILVVHLSPNAMSLLRTIDIIPQAAIGYRLSSHWTSSASYQSYLPTHQSCLADHRSHSSNMEHREPQLHLLRM